MHGTSIEIPAPMDAYLAPFYPYPAEHTLPRMTSFTSETFNFIEDKADCIAIDANSGPLNLDNFPRKDPMGVLLPATIYTVF